MTTLHLGQILSFDGSPFDEGPTAAWHERQGGLVVGDGRILAVGPADAMRMSHPEAEVIDHGEGLIVPGFVDAHAHYPQTGMIASWGKRLID